MCRVEPSLAASAVLMKLVQLPVEKYSSINTALQLENLVKLASFFSFEMRHELAVAILRRITDRGDTLKTGEEVSNVAQLLLAIGMGAHVGPYV